MHLHQRGKTGYREAYGASDSYLPMMTYHPCGLMREVSKVESQEWERAESALMMDTLLLAWKEIGGIVPDLMSGTLSRTEVAGLCRACCIGCVSDKKMESGFQNQKPSEFLRAMVFDEVCPERLLDAPFDWEEPQLEGTDPWLIPPGVHGRLATPVMDPRTLGDVQGMSIASRRDGSGTTAVKWFLEFRAWERDCIYGLTNTMRRAVLLSLIPASRSNPLKDMVNRYQLKCQDLPREVTEEIFTEANDDVILEAFRTIKPSSLTPMPREFVNVVEEFLVLGRRVRDGITQRQAKYRLLDVVAAMKVDGLLKETKVGLEFNYLELMIFRMNPLMSRHKLNIKKGHIVRRVGHALQESPQPKALQQTN